jgi:hypothetical protein
MSDARPMRPAPRRLVFVLHAYASSPDASNRSTSKIADLRPGATIIAPKMPLGLFR